jgi:hypothetical protein
MVDRRALQDWLEVVRSFVGLAALATALLVFVALVLSGVHVVALVLVPIAMLAAALSSPEALVLLVLAILTAHALVLTAATIVAGLRRLPARPHSDGPDGPQVASGLTPELRLRRRYLAGDMAYADFQSAMLAVLKDRYARGDIGLIDFETEVERLLRPARDLGVGRGDGAGPRASA